MTNIFFCITLSQQDKHTLSPALEAAIDYQLKVLSVAITYGGISLLRYKGHLIEAISSAFNSSSWKVLFFAELKSMDSDFSFLCAIFSDVYFYLACLIM